jgi:2-haloacid dehalogenase
MSADAFLFDVFGTLVDWRSAVARQITRAFAAKALTVDALAFADMWRGLYQPSMDPVRRGVAPYRALDDLHLDSLKTVLKAFDADTLFSEPEQTALARSWERLDPWPDTVHGLQALRPHGLLASCSNGSTALISRLARHAALPFDAILGADAASNYKPHADVYLASCAALRLPPERVVMVAAHGDDLKAAAALGLQTAFILRETEHGAHQTSDLTPGMTPSYKAQTLVGLALELAQGPQRALNHDQSRVTPAPTCAKPRPRRPLSSTG